jgi:SynChlorMet cassette protein ScmC
MNVITVRPAPEDDRVNVVQQLGMPMSGEICSGSEANIGLGLADGTTWSFAAADEQAAAIVSGLRQAMQLRVLCRSDRRLIVRVDSHDGKSLGHCRLPNILSGTPQSYPSYACDKAPLTALCFALRQARTGVMSCFLSPVTSSDLFALQLMQLSLVIGADAQPRGGFLLHGALAEKNGYGVILAGPGGGGKTTASRRLPYPWRSLCDDATLIIRDEQGLYWAHPWPTWSAFLSGGSGGSWDVQYAVPLRGIFFLNQANIDRVESMGAGKAIGLLTESAEQAYLAMSHGLRKNELRVLRTERFNNVCALAEAVPVYLLKLSLNGCFWHEVERAIACCCKNK